MNTYCLNTLIDLAQTHMEAAVDYGAANGILHYENDKYFPTSALYEALDDLFGNGQGREGFVLLSWMKELAVVQEGDWFTPPTVE